MLRCATRFTRPFQGGRWISNRDRSQFRRRNTYVKSSEEEDRASEIPTTGPLDVSTAAISTLMQAVSVGETESRLESFLEYIPDSLLDKAIEAKKGAG